MEAAGKAQGSVVFSKTKVIGGEKRQPVTVFTVAKEGCIIIVFLAAQSETTGPEK